LFTSQECDLTYVDVARNISPLLISVKIVKQVVKTIEKRAISPSRTFIEVTQYKMLIARIGKEDATTVVTWAVTR
jgi:EAL domain-containing protein (putative c-di-GMP-specific phosphodiesterase class I)